TSNLRKESSVQFVFAVRSAEELKYKTTHKQEAQGVLWRRKISLYFSFYLIGFNHVVASNRSVLMEKLVIFMVFAWIFS
ncbi:hypothetical protein L9F63_021092, partial [Diploptera punctata]